MIKVKIHDILDWSPGYYQVNTTENAYARFIDINFNWIILITKF